MGMQWVIVEGETWRVVRVRGFKVDGLWVIEGEEIRKADGESLVERSTLTPGPSPGGRGEKDTLGADASGSPRGDAHFAMAVTECLQANGYRGEGVLMGLASWRAAVGEIGPQPVEVERDQQAMTLALEGELPWAAEEFVADFVRLGSTRVAIASEGEPGGSRLPLAGGRNALTTGPSPGGRGEKEGGHLGIAVRSDVLSRWLEEWAQAGIWIQGICPWTLVRIQGLLRERLIGPDDLIVIGEGGGDVSQVQLADGKVARWNWLPEGMAVRERLMVDGLWLIGGEEIRNQKHEIRKAEEESRVSVIGVRDEIVAELRELFGDRLRVIAEPTNGGAIQAGRILSGRERPWIDWRRGMLADPHPYRAVRGLALLTAVAWLVALGISIAALQSRAAKHESQATQLTEQQIELFKSLLPGQKVTVGVRRRLESEVARLKAERGDSQSRGKLVSTPEILERGLAGLPEAVRMRVKSIEVDGSRFHLDCETRTIADATAIVESMNQGGFEVTAPRTELVNGIVPLRIVAEWKGETVSVGATSALTPSPSSGGRGAKETPGADASGSSKGPKP